MIFEEKDAIDTKQYPIDDIDLYEHIDNITDFYTHMRNEFVPSKIDVIFRHLWVAGKPNNIQPLNKQLCHGKKIVLTSDINMHMVWYGDTIFIKPFPTYCSNFQIVENTMLDESIYSNVCGFINSYTLMIRCLTDFNIAKENKLFDISWDQWKVFSSNVKKQEYTNRYKYGTLRLHRLNLIYRFSFNGLYFFNLYSEYGEYMSQYFTISIIIFAFMTIILTCGQVLLAISARPDYIDHLFYALSMISLFLCISIIVFTICIFISLFLYFLINTLTK